MVGDIRKLEGYKYTLGAAAVALLLVTMVVGTTINGARLWIRLGGVQVQPGEFSKLLLVVFLAGYLREKREVLTMTHRARAGHRLPGAPPPGPAADDDRRRAGRGRRDERHGHGAAAVRHLPGDALRRDRPRRCTRWSASRCSRPVRGSCTRRRRTCRSGSRSGSTPGRTRRTRGYQIIQSIDSIADGGVFGTGLGRSFQLLRQRHAGHPRRPDGRHLRRLGQRDRAGRRGRPSCSSTCCSATAASRWRRWPMTASRSCSPPG